MASSLAGSESEKPGQDQYVESHMDLIFGEGLSFSGFERNRVFMGKSDARFEDVSDLSGADSEGDCRAVCVADFDDDGDPDLFVNAIQRDCHLLYRNDTLQGQDIRYVKVLLEATAGHPGAIGAIVYLETDERTVAQTLAAGSGYAGQSAPELIFGLGGTPSGSIRVKWPGRETEDFGRIGAGGRYVLEEGKGQVKVRRSRQFKFGTPPPRGVRVRVGDKLDPLLLPDLDGEMGEVAPTGKPLLLNFWATTCKACREELPTLEAINKKGAVRVVTISFDSPTRTDVIRRLWENESLTLDARLIGDDLANRLFDLPRLAIPFSILLAPDGTVRRLISGKLKKREFR